MLGLWFFGVLFFVVFLTPPCQYLMCSAAWMLSKPCSSGAFMEVSSPRQDWLNCWPLAQSPATPLQICEGWGWGDRDESSNPQSCLDLSVNRPSSWSYLEAPSHQSLSYVTSIVKILNHSRGSKAFRIYVPGTGGKKQIYIFLSNHIFEQGIPIS